MLNACTEFIHLNKASDGDTAEGKVITVNNNKCQIMFSLTLIKEEKGSTVT